MTRVALPSQPIEPVRLRGPVVVDSEGMENSEEVQRIISLLERLIAYQKVPISTIENQMGVSQGYLARLFRGETHLRYQHVLDVLEAIGVPPRGFFKLAYELDGGEGDLRALASLPSLAKPSQTLVPLSEADFENLLHKALVKFDLIKPPPTSPAPSSKKRGPRRPK